jgi:DNA-binding LacI/PurR family transcriptional regulator
LAKYFTPSITSVNPHNEEMAVKVAHIIRSKEKGKNTDFCQYVVQPELVIRET